MMTTAASYGATTDVVAVAVAVAVATTGMSDACTGIDDGAITIYGIIIMIIMAAWM